MDSCYIDQSAEDSLPSRSRSNSHLSTATTQFQHLNIKPPASSNQEEGTSLSTEGPTTSSSTFLDPDPLPSTSNFISAPQPQQLTPFPDFSQEDLDANWSFTGASEDQSTQPPPLLRLDSVPTLPSDTTSRQPISRSNSFPANMSAVGVQQYDNRFDAGIQPSYTWPRFDSGDQFFPQQMSPPMLNSTLNPYDEKLMPMYTRSVSSSPPRGNLTPEQRELKRQRELSRRDSKVRMRRDRSTSNPYSISPRPSPEMMSRTLSEFSNNGLTPSPHLSQGSQGSPSMSAMGSPNYLAGGFTPQLGDPTADLYGNTFSMPSNDMSAFPAFVGMPNYGLMNDSLNNFVPRPHSLSSSSDQPNMQQMHNVYNNANLKMEPDHVRVVHSRPKPQCWEHGCNGRQFSTFSNLLRHQREKSGQATKSSCPNCGAEFTRTTARNGHMAHEKCKQRRST
ncbi:hypothetical protein B0O99DRAFT_647537 [Bisporella sp. PMI_857]|nr:hypothetical protein B0O99DRAFT_647537 [Bisporella sp. PMI_857]